MLGFFKKKKIIFNHIVRGARHLSWDRQRSQAVRWGHELELVSPSSPPPQQCAVQSSASLRLKPPGWVQNTQRSFSCP